MKKFSIQTGILTVCASIACASAVFAVTVLQDRAITGAILDAKCAKSFLHSENVEMAVADHHTIECTLSEQSLKDGLVILVGNKLIKIDPATNKVVVEFLKSPKASQIARVTGTDGPNGFVVKSVRPSSDK